MRKTAYKVLFFIQLKQTQDRVGDKDVRLGLNLLG